MPVADRVTRRQPDDQPGNAEDGRATRRPSAAGRSHQGRQGRRTHSGSRSGALPIAVSALLLATVTGARLLTIALVAVWGLGFRGSAGGRAELDGPGDCRPTSKAA
jgi:hypothetical protein